MTETAIAWVIDSVDKGKLFGPFPTLDAAEDWVYACDEIGAWSVRGIYEPLSTAAEADPEFEPAPYDPAICDFCGRHESDHRPDSSCAKPPRSENDGVQP